MKWNAELYEQFKNERLQPTLDLIGRLPQGNYKKIVDVGCGSGMSTLPLCEVFNEAVIYGVDLSEEMLTKARETSNKINWIQRDCSRPLDDLGKFDLVFSNAFLQWLQNQEAFIAHVKNLLNENGVFALQVPNYDGMPIKACIDRVVSQFDKDFTKAEQIMCHNFTLSQYYDMLGRYFKEVTIWQTNYVHVMTSCEDIVQFVSGTGLRPYFEELTGKEQKEFVNRVIDQLKEVYPVQENGKVLFTFERIEWIAR